MRRRSRSHRKKSKGKSKTVNTSISGIKLKKKSRKYIIYKNPKIYNSFTKTHRKEQNRLLKRLPEKKTVNKRSRCQDAIPKLIRKNWKRIDFDQSLSETFYLSESSFEKEQIDEDMEEMKVNILPEKKIVDRKLKIEILEEIFKKLKDENFTSLKS